jgi:Arc/MetJ-type ribon-helix-helix transcriptional regulator
VLAKVIREKLRGDGDYADASEFLRLVEHLRDLEQHPGWQFLVELVEDTRADVEAKSDAGKSPGRLAAQIASDPIKVAVALAATAGELKGLGRFLELRQQVVDAATAHQAELEREAGV